MLGFSIGPRIRQRDDRLEWTTSWFTRVVSLETSWRRVVVDPARRRIDLHTRWLWAFGGRRRIRFSSVAAVTYGYVDDAIFQMSYAHESFDNFTVGLRLTDDEEISRASFVGDGSFVNNGPFPDWCYWEEYAFDVTGSQVAKSRLLVDLLTRMLDVTVTPPRR